MALFFFKSHYFLPKILHDDSDDNLEIIMGAIEKEGSTSHCGRKKGEKWCCVETDSCEKEIREKKKMTIFIVF